MTEIATIARRVDDLQRHYQRRDQETAMLRALRSGDWESLMPGAFSDEWYRW